MTQQDTQLLSTSRTHVEKLMIDQVHSATRRSGGPGKGLHFHFVFLLKPYPRDIKRRGFVKQ
jgi:hypothetical protein